MPRIVHSALKVDDFEKATEFDEKGLALWKWKRVRSEIIPRAISLTGLSILL